MKKSIARKVAAKKPGVKKVVAKKPAARKASIVRLGNSGTVVKYPTMRTRVDPAILEEAVEEVIAEYF